MKWFYRLCRQDPDTREGVVMATSILGVLANLLVAGAKVGIGVLASSIAIVSEGVNNAADAVTSVLTIVGTKLAGKRPTKKHPFGFGRIEYLTSLVIAAMILLTGWEFLAESVRRIFHPPEGLSITYLALGIVVGSAVVKLALGIYTVAMGRKVGSGPLVAVGTDCKNDVLVSLVTILSAVVFLAWGVSIDAYAGVVTSVFILKAGFDVMKETVGALLGQPADKAFADALYRRIRANPLVLNAADMMLHNYGPDRYSGSVNIEVDHSTSVSELYAAIHRLQLDIMHELGVTMVFGVYAVDRDHAAHRELRKLVADFVRGYDHAVSYHAIYIPEGEKKIYCDIVVDYELHDWADLREAFTALMRRHYPDYGLELVIETEYV